jgi:protein-disulfide isomerase
MFDALMSNQRALADSDLTGHATKIGLDLDAWNTCRKDPAQAAEVQKDFEDGTKAGVQGTPAFFINGIFLNGAVPLEQFTTIIDAELAG